MTPISIQLYTLREQAAKDFPAVLKTVADIGYKAVEFAGLHGHSPADVRKMTDDLGLEVSSSHISLPTKENISQLADTERMLGNTRLVAGFGPDQFKTLDDCKASAEKFQTAAQLAKDNGMTFAMHNHWWEFGQMDGRLVFDILLEAAPDLQSELDVYWVQTGGPSPVEVITKNAARLPLLHIKDGPAKQGEPMTAVGSGTLDIPAIVKAADPNVTKYLIVELDACATDMTEAVRQSYQYLTQNGLAAGNK